MRESTFGLWLPAAALLLAACGEEGEAVDLIDFFEEDVTIGELVADPADIVAGESTTLRWTVENATACFLHPEPGEVAHDAGEIVVTPTVTTTYELICQERERDDRPVESEDSATVTVTVTQPMPG